MCTHPNDLELEELRGGEASADIAAHVAQCAHCQQRMQELLQLSRRLSISTAIEVPEAIDEAMRQRIAQHATRVRDLRRRQRKPVYVRPLHWLAPVAAAASIALFLTLSQPTQQSLQPQSPAALAADINGDGQVNIVDAMLLARALEAGRPLPARWDIDGDQRVDRSDVDAIGHRAVAMEELRP